jgi:metallophosphoesterase (TIGR00282 family)
MKILYIGDVMGEPGLEIVEKILPKLRRERSIDLVIAQAENLTEGRGVSLADFAKLKKAGVDFCTGGNWSLWREEIIPALADPNQPIIRPANYPTGTPGLGHKYSCARSNLAQRVLVVSLLGQVVGRDANKEVDNPLKAIDEILEQEKSNEKVVTIVNFHGDYSSEKVVIGHYLDGRVTAVIGDHWHVPTNDARVLPGGTAHITDVGMCGALDSSLGVKYSSIIPRWLGQKTKNELETAGPRQFNGVLIESDDKTGLAKSIEQININYD